MTEPTYMTPKELFWQMRPGDDFLIHVTWDDEGGHRRQTDVRLLLLDRKEGEERTLDIDVDGPCFGVYRGCLVEGA